MLLMQTNARGRADIFYTHTHTHRENTYIAASRLKLYHSIYRSVVPYVTHRIFKTD